MSSMFQYDPMDILTRAQKSADESWDNTLNFARKRAELDQQAMDNAFKNDKQFNTHGTDLFKTNNMNQSAGLKAANESFVYGRALSPENQTARSVSIDNAYQSPAARLVGDVAGAGIADLAQRNSASLDASKQFGGALGTHAVYGQSATNASSSNVASDIAAGLFPRANESLRTMGIDMQVAQGPTADTVVLVGADGRPGAQMPINEAAKFINDRTGVRAGTAQVYMDQAQIGQDKFQNQMALNDAKLAQRNNYLQSKMQTEEGKLLVRELDLAQKSGDATRLHDAQMKLTDFHNRAHTDFEKSYTPGGVYGPQVQRQVSAADIVNGRPAAPAAPAAPAPAPASEKKPSAEPEKAVYVPAVNKGAPAKQDAPESYGERLMREAKDPKAKQARIEAEAKAKADEERARMEADRIAAENRKKIADNFNRTYGRP